MTSTVDATTDVALENREQWLAWAVPPRAVLAWVELQGAVRALRRPPACEHDPEAWWATRGTPTLAALQDEAAEACGWCPVVDVCRAYAVAAGERHGVWGGLRPDDRFPRPGRAGS